MKKSKISILLLFIVMILAISAVSAADAKDTSDSAVQAVDETPVEEVASADVGALAATDGGDVVAEPDDGNNFTSLSNKIKNSQHDFAQINKDYAAVEGDQVISIEKDFALISTGGNHKIDAKNLCGIFEIKEGVNFILEGITLVNGHADNGGAIVNNGELQLINCIFENNNATNYGGAIYNLGELDIDDCTFKDNTATYKGGAVYSVGTVDVSGSTFDGNDIKYRSGKNTDFNGGAAIYNLKGNLTVDNSKFKNNVKNYEIRSATDFDNLDGAVTSISGTVAISNSEFRNNSARYGSAILISSLQDGADGTFTIDNCQFYDNLALAGAIQVWDRDKKFEFTILNSWFENNTATGITDPDHTAAGGALAFIDVKEAKINGTTFKENKVTNIAKKPKGGAINIQGSNVDIDYCTFEANHADTNGGAINVYSGSVDVNNSKFINNDATINGGAINLDNYTAYGYAIAVANVENSNFTGNTATAAGNAIYNNGKLALSGNTIDAGANIVSSGTITSPIIAVVTADKTTYRIEQITLTARLTDDMGTVINDTTFKFVFNTPAGLAAIPATLGDDGNYTVRFTPTKDGEYNVTVNHAGDITNATFTVYRTLTDLKELVENATDGDTINLDGDYTYNDEFDASFTGIVTSSSLTINGNGYTICGQDKTCNLFNVSGHKLTLNNLTICHFNNTVDGLGGAISVSPSGTLTANYVNFTDNTAKYKGGAIYNNGGTVIVNHTVFDGNDIKYRSGANTDFNGGAAIYNLKGTLTVDDSTIKNNVKNYEIRSDTDFDNLDGAITSISGTVAISNSEFRNNSARYGSAILISAVDDADGTFTIDNCQFYDNLALAGAIQVWDRKNKFEFTILNSWFENNTATGDTDIAHTAAGGALVLTNVKEAKINGTTFKENKVIHIAKKPKGGAINIQDCNHVDIDYCTFEGNHADTNGGAINVYSGSVDVNNSKFINNDATINGGAINIENNTAAGYAIGVATVENSNFTGNTAANGNAINNNGKLTLSKNIISTNQADIVSEGEIESQINVTTHNAVVHYGEKVNLTATITDDKGNLINSSDFYFVVNTVNYGPAVYNPATGKYEFEQEFSLPVGTYEITMYREGKELTYVEKGNLTATPKKGTYSDLQAQIDALAPGETLELTYDFAYDATYDDAKFPNGVVINKALTINGNDHFISGADTVRIFRIGTFANANISGVVFKNGKADKGGALFVAGKLSIDNCTFVNNTATVSGNDIHIMTSSVVVVNGEDSYNYLLNDPDSSLNKYYADNPREDGIDANGNPVHDSTTPIVGHSWESAITTWMDPVTIDGTTYAWQDGYSKFPWILINLDDYTGPIVFKYDGEIKFVWDVANKQRGVISVLEDLKMPDYTLTYQYGTVRDKVFDPNLLTVEYNGTSAGKAVIMLSTPGDIVSIKNSVFDSDGYSIYNLGALDLENNTIKGVIYNNGTIISEINAVVLDNKTINVTSKTYELNATLTDDIGNKIYDPELRFTVNGEKIADKPDYNNGLYTFTSNKFTTDYPSYLIDLSSDNEFSLAAETGIIINVLRGTFTDLQQRIDAANSELNLTYNFTYSDEFDSALKDGVVIDESIVINGNAVTIDANNTARIFNITNNAVLTLTNATLTNGKANLGGAIYVNAGSTLKADYVNFTNNNATYKGGAVYSKGTVIANHTVFDGNDIEYRASRNNRDFNGGAAIYNSKGTLTVDNSIIKNNVKNYGIRNATDYDNLDGAITSISGIVNISNSEFRNNSARYGSAILISSEDATDGTFTIDTCQFYDNIALAGAIQVWDRSNKFEFTILNSWFENNTATGNTTLGHTAAGGALVLNSVKKAKINGTTFKENKVTHIANNPKGGAINIEKPTYLPDAIVDIEIDNCTFDNNHADSNGGAINLNDGNLNVINSKFINNDATNNGGAIHVEKGAADVEGSNFTGNTATKGASIYNAGNLTLSKNNITSGKSEIESTGLIKSELNATFLDNKTWNDTGIGDIYTLNATLTDDNGNNIYDPNFKFAVNGDEIYDIIYDNETGVYRTGYAIKTAGYKVISSKYEADGLTKYTGALDIALENLTDFTVTVEDIIEGENATVFIRAYSTNNLGEQIAADGKVTVILNNTKYTIDVVNGTGNKTIEGLAHGQYPVTAIFEKNSNYNEAINATVFYVRSTQANLTVEIEDIKYGEALTVNINLTDADGNPLTAIVVVNIAGEDYYVPVIGGIASLDILEKFNVTKYNYTVTFESELYNTTIYKDSFNVIPLEVYLGVRTNDGVAVGEEGEIKVIIYDDYDNIFAGEEVELVFTNETGDIVAVCKILTADDIRGPEGSYVLDFTKDWEIGRYYVSVKSQNFIFKQSSDEDEDPAYYQFTSYAVDGTEWGTGIAEVNGSSSGYIKVKVVSNSYSDEFVGKVFFIVDSAVADGETLYELFDENAVGTGIFVKVSPAFEYLVHKKMIDAVVIEGDGDYVYGDEHIVVIDLGNYVDAYNFTSYGDEACTIEYGIGIVEVGDVVGDYISVKVISNDFDDRFVGQTFYVLDKEYGEDEPIQLSMMNDNNEIVPVNLWVKVSELRDYYNLINITCPATVIVLWEDDEQQYNKTIETEFVNGELSVDLSGLKPGEYTLIVKIDDATYELHSYDYDRDIEYPYALLYPDDYLFKVEEDHVYVNNVNGTDWTQYGDERIFNFELWHHYWIGDNDVDELFVYNTTASVIIYSVVRDENGTIISIDKLDDYVINITDGISDSINLTHLNAGEYKVTVMLIDTNYTIEGWDEDVLVIYGFTSYGDENGITEYGVGMVAVIGDAEDGYIPVRVILNVPDSSFDGQLFYIKDDAKEDELNQLYKMNDNNEFVSVDIWVSVSKLSDKDTPWYAEHFNVDKAGVEVNVNASSITYGETANVTITVVTPNGEKLNETVEVFITGFDSFNATLVNGTVTVEIPYNLNVGTYAVWVNFLGTDNYWESYNNIDVFDVSKATPTLEVNSTSAEWDTPVSIFVNLTGVNGTPIVGSVIVKVLMGEADPAIDIVELDENGTGFANFRITEALGTFDVVATFDGNDNYNGAQGIGTLTITECMVPELKLVVDTPVDYNEIVYVNATLTNARGAVIANATLTYSIDGGENKTIKADKNGTVSIPITGLAGGKHTITVSFNNESYSSVATDDVTVTVTPIVPSEFTGSASENNVYGNNVTITVTAPGLEGNVSLSIDSEIVSTGKPLKDGTVIFEVPDLAAGHHSFLVTFNGNENFTVTSDTNSFDVAKATPTINVGPYVELVYNDTYSVSFNVTGVNGEFVNGTVLAIRPVVEEYANALYFDDGTGTISFAQLPVGEYPVVVRFLSDNDNYKNAEKEFVLNITQAELTIGSEVVTADPKYGDDVVVNVTVTGLIGDDTVEASVSVFSVYGLLKDKFTIVLGKNDSFTLSGYDAGNYTYEIAYDGSGNYKIAGNSSKFIVDKADSSVTVDPVEDAVYGDIVVVSYSVENRTSVVIKFYNGTNTSQEISDIKYDVLDDSVEISDLVPGSYMIVVINTEGSNYYGSSANTTFTVTKAEPAIIIYVESAYYTSDFNVTFEIDPAFLDYTILVVNETFGLVNFTADGNTIVLSNLTTGKYTIGIATFENDNYTVGTNTVSFYVSIVDIGSPENSSDTVFEINMPKDATGYLLVDIDGQHYYAELVNGTASVSVPGLVAGNYTANVTYTGDDNYPGFSTTKNVTVESNVPDNAFNIPTSAKSDEPTTYSISLPSDAKGYLEVDVDGTKYVAALNNGSASVTIPALSAGNHNVTVTYTGDGKYTPVIKATTLSVADPVYAITQNNDVSVVYSANAAYKVLITKDGKAVGAGESVVITFNGKKTTVVTDANGYATLNLNTKVKVKTYTITAEYKGVNVTNNVKVTHLIKAKNTKIKKSKKVNKIKVKTNKVNGKFLKGKKLTLKIKGKKVKAKINKKGVAKFKLKKNVLKKLKVGKKYKYTVSYGKDKVTKKIKIKA